MPYISPESKALCSDPETPGELTYWLIMAELADINAQTVYAKACRYLRWGVSVGEAYGFEDLCHVLGSFTAATCELVRRTGRTPKVLDEALARFYLGVVAPYEDEKIKKNGDIFPEEVLKDE